MMAMARRTQKAAPTAMPALAAVLRPEELEEEAEVDEEVVAGLVVPRRVDC